MPQSKHEVDSSSSNMVVAEARTLKQCPGLKKEREEEARKKKTGMTKAQRLSLSGSRFVTS